MTPKGTSMSGYTIWDDAESKVQFLQSGFKGKDWQTTLVYPYTPDHAHDAELVKHKLEARGYLVKRDRDEHGNLTLTIHHTGDGTKLTDILRSEGLIKGTGHLISKPKIPLGNLVRGVGETIANVKGLMQDPARASATIFLGSEMVHSVAGFGNVHGHWWEPKNMLQNVAGLLWMSQSLTYMKYAKRQDEVALETLHDQFDDLKAEGKNVLDAKGWTVPEHTKPENIFEKFTGALADNPIQAGALFNNAGMLAHMAHTLLERKTRLNILKNPGKHTKAELKDAAEYAHNGFYFDFGRSLTSFVAWAALLYPVKEHPEKSNNPFVRAFQTFEENPQYATGTLAIASSSSGLYGSLKKRNKVSALGEAIYIPGDVLMLFANSSHYGNEGRQDVDKTAEAIAKFVEDMPLALGPETRYATVKNIIAYMAKLDEEKKKEQGADYIAETNDFAAALYERTKSELDKHISSFEEVTAAAARLINRFPKNNQAQALNIITQEISRAPSVHASSDELAGAIHSHQKENHVAHHPRMMPSSVSMNDIASDIADLAYAIPGIDVGSHALQLRQALAPFTHLTPRDERTLHMAMDKKAEQCLSGECRTEKDYAMAR